MSLTQDKINYLKKMCITYDEYIGLSLGRTSSLKNAKDQIKHYLKYKMPVPIKILNEYNREALIIQLKHKLKNNDNKMYTAIRLGKTEFYLNTTHASYLFYNIMFDICNILGILT